LPDHPTSTAAHRGLVALLIVAAFIISGGIHYQTPMLAAIAAEFQADAATTGWIPTLSFGGMMVGILFFVPLGDRIDKRRLVLAKFIVLALAQATMAAAPSIEVLAAGSLVTGITSSLGLSFIAITAEIAHPDHRGRALGTQLMAMFCGILFARIVGGLIAAHLGWRYSYVLSTAMLVGIIPVLWARLPSTRPTTNAPYGALLASLWKLYRAQGGIRRATAIQFMFGICYGAYVALLPTIVMDLYGARSVSGIIGCLYTGAGVGTLLGPWLAGKAYDALGAYDLPIAAGAALSFLAAACVALLIHTEKTHGKKTGLSGRG